MYSRVGVRTIDFKPTILATSSVRCKRSSLVPCALIVNSREVTFIQNILAILRWIKKKGTPTLLGNELQYSQGDWLEELPNGWFDYQLHLSILFDSTLADIELVLPFVNGTGNHSMQLVLQG